jgi:hypothetical protein
MKKAIKQFELFKLILWVITTAVVIFAVQAKDEHDNTVWEAEKKYKAERM